MTADGLLAFKAAFVAFITAVSRLSRFGDPKGVANLLAAHKLLPNTFLAAYTVLPKGR
jgi:hypothetical protein